MFFQTGLSFFLSFSAREGQEGAGEGGGRRQGRPTDL